MGIDLERVREYNKRCNSYKEKLSELSAERKIVSANLDNICKQLEKQLGREVTTQNIEEVYQAESLKVMNTLEAGESILQRIERAENGGQEQTSMAGNPVNEQAPMTGQATMAGNPGAINGFGGTPVNQPANNGFNGAPVNNGFDQPANTGVNQPANNTGVNQPANNGGFEQSSYKIPSNFGAANPFARQSGFSGKFNDFSASDDDDEEGIKIF